MKNELDLYHCLKIIEIYHDPKDSYLVRFLFQMKNKPDGHLYKLTEKQKNYIFNKSCEIAIRKCYSDIYKNLNNKD
jgi:hypothetical protein